MYLKRLESVGFKSFAERINVEFVPGLTAVVGPNGSGKSNITDAIRWVLGEQSVKSLRGSKMEDIIFQGSDTRNPLNVAEVTLVLDNSNATLPIDYNEISVTRRVYRSGVSEFYINKQACRLKDIVDLFMGSGLGREAFSIISQGKVEDVLSSKAEERRTIFEEAAGVLKYKQRKIKAEYKLAETEENLLRVNDIVYEIEQQIDPLKIQAETAQKYLKQREMLKKEEISLLITEIEQLHHKWKTLLADIEAGKIKEVSLKSSIQQKEARLIKEREEIQKIDDDIEDLQARLLNITQQLEQSEGKKQVLYERTKHFSENKAQLQQQKSKMEKKVEHFSHLLRNEEDKLAKLQLIRKNTVDNMKELENKLSTEKETITEKIEQLKSIYIDYLNEQAAKRNEKQSITEQLKRVNLQGDKQQEDFEKLVSLKESALKERTEISRRFTKQKDIYEAKATDLKELKTKLEKNQITLRKFETQLNKDYQSMARLTSRKDTLEEMKEAFQGFFHGVKQVLKAREKNILANVYGAVIELIDVPKQYVTAIETALGGQAQHVIVKDDQAARQAITWLKKTNSGRATFLPLHSIQSRVLPAHMLNKIVDHTGFIELAANVINVDSKYKIAINHLIGNVILAKTLEDANNIAKIINRRNRIVTLEGDVVHPGGSMSGGARRQVNQSLFTRDKELKELTAYLATFQDTIKRREQKIMNLKQQIELLKETIIAKEGKLRATEDELRTIQSMLNKKEMKLESIHNNLSMHDEERKQFKEDKELLNKRDSKLTLELKAIEQKLLEKQTKIAKMSEEEATFQENQEITRQRYHEQQILFAEQEERLRSQKDKTKMVKTELIEAEEQNKALSSELEQLLDVEKMQEEQEQVNVLITEMNTNKEKTMNQIQLKRSDRSKRTQLIQDEEREVKEENKQHQLFTKKMQKKEVQANRLDVDLENRLSHLQTEYTITFEKAMQTYEKTTDVESTKQAVNELKESIKRLGTVNLGSIDEFERISERYTFLTEQKDDLVEAKETLFDVIAELDEEMETLFEETFTQIKQEFSVVFRELFGGGNAKLKLTDPENLLDTGIDIIAQPPGKKLQQLGLLSGGERALTAIALLFSILRVRPVPFCVLDEVESSLDEANVSLFAKYVKMHSKDTQFIVITHRKGTMEEADVLYGVTMQESGVSRLVSVRLEDTAELVN